MGQSVSQFAHANPTTSGTFNSLVGSLDDLLKRAGESAARQIEGITQSRGATALRASVEALLRSTHLDHLLQVATSASQERPDILPSFRIPKKEGASIRGFRNAVARIAQAGQENRELLSKYGLGETMIEDLLATLEKYDGTVLQGVDGRQAHVEASAELTLIAGQVSRIVQVMDGFQRLRFAQDPEKLTAWDSARRIVAERRSPETSGDQAGSDAPSQAPAGPSGPSTGGTPASDVRPAA